MLPQSTSNTTFTCSLIRLSLTTHIRQSWNQHKPISFTKTLPTQNSAFGEQLSRLCYKQGPTTCATLYTNQLIVTRTYLVLREEVKSFRFSTILNTLHNLHLQPAHNLDWCQNSLSVMLKKAQSKPWLQVVFSTTFVKEKSHRDKCCQRRRSTWQSKLVSIITIISTNIFQVENDILSVNKNKNMSSAHLFYQIVTTWDLHQLRLLIAIRGRQSQNA